MSFPLISWGSQEKTGSGSKFSANGKVRPDAEKNSEEAAAEQSRVPGVKTETRAEAGTSSRQPQNWTVWFSKSNHPVSAASGQKRPSKTTVPRIAPTPQWCPPGLTPSRRRRVQQMRMHKMREEVAEKERDEYFNIIRPVIPMKQEWRVKKKIDTPAPTTFDDDMNLLDDDEAPLIKDESPPPTNMDINMVFTLPTEFKGIEEVTQMCLGLKEAVFEKPEELSQHWKPLYIQGHIDRSPISRMLINGGATVNLTSYSVFRKVGREDDELVKTNLTLNGVEGNPMEAQGAISLELTVGSMSVTTAFFVIEVQGNYSVILGRDWIHANRCVPLTLHQFLIQWIDDEIEVVHANASAYIALADATADWQHGGTQCLSGRDLTGYDFLSVSKEGFMPVSVKPVFEARLSNVVFQ
jgi:hypothetical protein